MALEKQRHPTDMGLIRTLLGRFGGQLQTYMLLS